MTTVAPDDLPVFDQPTALKRVGGKLESLRLLAKTFAGEFPKLLAQLESARASEQSETFRRAAHTIKGSAVIFGSARVEQWMIRLEQSGKAADWPTIDAIRPAAEAACRELLAQITAV